MTLPGQMELATVIDHKTTFGLHDCATTSLPDSFAPQDTHKPVGIRLAKMLRQYDNSPSSDLWQQIQVLAAEALK